MFREYLRNLRLFNRNARLFLLATFIGSLGLGMVWVLRNLYLREIGLSDSRIGNVLSANSLGLLSVTPIAFFMDRYRLKRFLLVAGVLATAGVLGTVLTEDFHFILLWGFIAGLGGALGGVAAAPFIMRNTGTSERVYMFGVLIAVATFGGALSMSISGRYTWYWGDTAQVLRWVMIVGSAIATFSAIPLLLIQEPPLANSSKTDRSKGPSTRRAWGTIGRLCLPDFLIGCGAGLTIPFIQLYFRDRFHSSSAQISSYYAASQVINMFGFLVSPVLARRLGLVKSVVASQLFSIPFFLALAMTTDLRIAIGAFLLRQMLMNLAQPVNSNFAMEVVPEDQRAVTNCIKSASWNLSWLVTASLGGWMQEHFKSIWASLPWADVDPNRFGLRDGFSLVMYVTIVLYLVAAALFYAFFRHHRPATKGDTRVLVAAPVVAAGGVDVE